ncbi:MAG: transposase, partial [Candidatus Ornithospirochaeta sp.]
MPRARKEKDQIDQIIDQLDLNGITQEEMFGEGGLVKTLTTRLLNKALEAEMDHHLGYKKNSVAGKNSGNSRNGHTKKKVLTSDQEVELEVPRDRNGEFEPAIVPKYSKRIDLFNDQII